MNPADVVAVVDEEAEPEKKEKTVCARLVLSNEQVIIFIYLWAILFILLLAHRFVPMYAHKLKYYLI